MTPNDPTPARDSTQEQPLDDEQKCPLCGKLLLDTDMLWPEGWFDSEEVGDAHVKCLKEAGLYE